MNFDADALVHVLGVLSKRRPLFHSEADFQHALAWELHLANPAARVRLETRPLRDRNVFLDLLYEVDGARTALELKYLTRAFTTTIDGEAFQLRNHAAHDVRRYDIIKDIARLEEVVAAGAAHIGLVVVLTNDAAYWTASSRSDTSDAAFRIPEGATITGTLAWAATAGPGTTKGRETAISVTGAYSLGWGDYSDLGGAGGRFRRLVVEVLPAGHAVSTRAATAPESFREAPASAPRQHEAHERFTCREAVLAGLAALERRTGRLDFTVAELLAGARAAGAQQADATIRTHITSIMCVNAPANHAVRYPDLERVGPGRYQRARQAE
jgi:hypothetical protein